MEMLTKDLKQKIAKKDIVVAVNSLIGGLMAGPVGAAIGIISTLDSEPIITATDWIIRRQDEKNITKEKESEQPIWKLLIAHESEERLMR